MSKHTLIRLSLCLILCLAALSVPSAEAQLCGRETEIIFYAWISDSDPNVYWCSDPNVDPYVPVDDYAYWGPIGGREKDCDGYVTTWGDTSTCRDSENMVGYGAPCHCDD
jgi:hypothetical protein